MRYLFKVRGNKMGTDDLFNKRRKERQKRVSKELKIRAEKWLIVCEGEETEPNYFKRLLDYVNAKTDKKIKYTIEGTGRNTESLVSCIDGYFTFVDELKIKEDIPYGKVFAVFDKDSFKKGQFNNAIHMSIKKGYIPIWSNECIELWFLLHFDLLSSNITRNVYFKKLSKILGHEYQKSENHFDMLNTELNLKTAIQNANRLYCELQHISSYADRAPCTTVFKFIEEIEEYIGMKLC